MHAYGGSREHIIYIVRAYKVGVYLATVPTETQEGVAGYYLAFYCQRTGIALHTVLYLLQVVGNACQVLVVCIYEDLTAAFLAQEVIQLALGLYHTLKRAEALKVGLAYVCYDAVVGLHDVDEGLNLPRVVGAHLYHCYLVLFGKAQQSLWHSDVVVEVALRVKHVILLRENSGYEFLGGSLTVGACHAYNPCAERTAVLVGKLL